MIVPYKLKLVFKKKEFVNCDVDNYVEIDDKAIQEAFNTSYIKDMGYLGYKYLIVKVKGEKSTLTYYFIKLEEVEHLNRSEK